VPDGASLEIRGLGFRYREEPCDQPAESEEEAEEEADAEGPGECEEADADAEAKLPAPWTITPFSLTAGPGERLVVKGNSGSGKSTLFKLLSGFETPTVGTIRLGETASSSASRRAWRRHVLFVSQKWALFDGTILENMTIGTGVRGLTEDQMNAFARHYGFDAVIPDVGQRVGNSAATGGGQMSGGMGKLITLTRATLRLMPDEMLRKHFPAAQRAAPVPRVVLFDEPLAALDEGSRGKVLRLMQDLLAGAKTSPPPIAFFIMHNEDLDTFATRVMHIADGRLEGPGVEHGRPASELTRAKRAAIPEDSAPKGLRADGGLRPRARSAPPSEAKVSEEEPSNPGPQQIVHGARPAILPPPTPSAAASPNIPSSPLWLHWRGPTGESY
jgi:ABC-type multidrug transport system fused ATPase/permease subunit